jgi:Leucine-rich repeat (LRR) protein
MTRLETLWLSENMITRIRGLSKCKNLRKLFLSTNKISKIEGLEKLTKLEVLWLTENHISVIIMHFYFTLGIGNYRLKNFGQFKRTKSFLQ